MWLISTICSSIISDKKLFAIFDYFCALSLIFKCKIVNIDGISVLDAHFFQPLEQPALTQLQVKVVPGLVVIEVGLPPHTFNHFL